MAMTADHAESVIESLDAGETAPDGVDLEPFIEDDGVAMTPELWKRLSEDKQAEYNARVAERDRAELEAEQAELDAEQERAVAALTAATEDQTVAVPINDERHVQVRTYLSEAMERTFDRIADPETDREAVTDDVIDAIVWLIEDDDYADPEVWREFKRQRGFSGLMTMFDRLTEPVIDAVAGRGDVGNLQNAAEDS